jgi:hypothetical protein
MSKAKELFKGKPSKMTKVLDADTAFTEEVWCKPPSALSRKVFFEKMSKSSNLKDEDKQEAIQQMSELALDLILITSCDVNGHPFFDADDKQLLTEQLDKGYYDQMVQAGCEILNLPDTLTKALALNLDKLIDEFEDETEKK